VFVQGHSNGLSKGEMVSKIICGSIKRLLFSDGR
jgi:hypothetical protein